MKRESVVRKFEKKEKKNICIFTGFYDRWMAFGKIAILIVTSHVMLIIYF